MKNLLPPAIVAHHPGWAVEPVWKNEAGGRTVRLRGPGEQTRYLKSQPCGTWPSLRAEVARLRWASAHLPVPVVVDVGESDSREWMLTEALDGAPAHDLAPGADPAQRVTLIAEGLRTFHAAPVEACPFDFGVDVALDHVHHRAQANLIDPTRHFHPDFAHLTVASAVELLVRTRPTSADRVVCHGDFCAPNVLIREDKVIGFVDLGELGVADRWWDVAIAAWSIIWNFGAAHEALFYEAYGVERDEPRLRWYRLLYDLVS